MNVFDFLTHLRSLDIQVTVNQGKLRINAPKGAVTPDLLSELSARKGEILSLLSNMDPILTEGEEAPLSLAQENLWQLHRLTPDTTAYNMYAVFRLHGQLDVPALEMAIHSIVERHKILRTSFPGSVQNMPEQVIASTSSVEFRQISLPFSSDMREALHSLIEFEIRRPFDLFSGPLFRPILVNIKPDENVLILIMHHIISDGHSFNIFYDELAQAYSAVIEGGAADWLPLSMQYRDYAAWQRKWLSSDASHIDRGYWQSRLSGNVPELKLPIDHLHPLHTSSEGDYVELRINPGLSASLRELCRREGITLFTTVLTVFNIMLHRKSGQLDIVVCTPVAARDRIEFSRLIGYFNNTLLLRADLEKVATMRGLLLQTQALVVDALAHQMFPFNEVANFPNLSRTPLSRAMVVVLAPSNNSLQLPGVDVEELNFFNNAVQYDLSLELRESSGQWMGKLMYRKVLFERNTIERLAGEFVKILEEMVVDVNSIFSPNALERPGINELEIKNGIETPHTPPRTDLESRLARIWQDVLDVESIGIHDGFFELGGHSLLALRLFTRIELETGTSMPLSTLFKATTIAQLAHLIEDGNTDKTWDCLVPIQPHGTNAPFFCVHGVEGDVFGYRELINALGDNQPVIGLQAIGWDDPESCDGSIEQMAARYIEAMKSYQPRGPYRIGGYCFGGIVAYEMACQLEKMEEKVSLLAVLEGSMPVEGDNRVSIYQRLSAFLKHLPNWVRDYMNLSPEQLLSRIRTTLYKFRLKIQANPELERRMQAEEILNVDFDVLPDRNVELTRVNSGAFLHYEPKKYNGILTLFRARNRSINEVIFGSLDPRMGWGDLALGGVRIRMVDGFHRNIHLSPYVNSLASELRYCLEHTTD